MTVKSGGKRVVYGWVISAFLLLLAAGGAYYSWKKESNKLPDGTYQLVSAKYYSSQAKTWMEGKPGYGGTELKDFLIVKDLEIKDHTFFTFESSYGSFDNVSPFDFDLGNTYRVNSWSKTLKPLIEVEDYKKETRQVIKDYYQTSQQVNQQALDKIEEERIQLYQKRFKCKVSYDWDGKKVKLTFTDQKGKAVEEQVYQRLSSQEAKSLEGRYQKAVKSYKGTKS